MINSATEHQEAAAALLDVVYSSRVLLLLTLVRESRSALQSDGTSTPHRFAEQADAWQLLASAQAKEAAALRSVLLDPQVGLWGAQVIRRLRNSGGAPVAGSPAIWVELGFLHQVAAAAALRAGLRFTVAVPLRHGSAVLPGLGRASFADSLGLGLAEVRATDDGVHIVCGKEVVTLPEDTECDASGWEGLRRMRAEAPAGSLTVMLDDLGPYGLTEAAAPAKRLDQAAVQRWASVLASAWSLLSRDHRTSAEALLPGLLSLIPLPRGARLRPHSASTSDAFGCVLVSEPDPEDDDAMAAQLAVTLVHEFRHTLLNGLMFQAPLFGDCVELYHAPWRDDPRPLGGLVHGAYSFAGVTSFWRTRSMIDDGVAGELAAFEFALWRQQTAQILAKLAGHASLTLRGAALVAALQDDVGRCLTDPLPLRPARTAELAAQHHLAVWRTFHLERPQGIVHALAEAWLEGAVAPDAGEAVLVANPEACRVDALAVLARLMITAESEFEELRRAPSIDEAMPGAALADFALIRGEFSEATRLYVSELQGGSARPAAWAGLGLALCGSGDTDLGTVVTARPELLFALFREIGRRQGKVADPLKLAAWLS